MANVNPEKRERETDRQKKREDNDESDGTIHWRKELTFTRAHIASSLSKSLNPIFEVKRVRSIAKLSNAVDD